MSSKYLGRVTVRVNGTVQDSKPGASLDIGGITRESVVTDQDMGFTETPKPSRIECEIALKAGVTLADLAAFKDGSLMYECDTGQRYIIKDGYTAETISIASGSVKVVFMGKPAQEMPT